MKRPTSLTLIPGPCISADAARKLDQHLAYLNDQLAGDARLRDRTSMEFHEYTRGTNPYVLTVHPYNSSMNPKINDVQDRMDRITKREM